MASLPKRARAYRDLDSPVVLDLSTIEEPWSSVRFEARLSAGAPDAGATLLDGVLVNTGAGARAGDQAATEHAQDLQAFCLLCPHEICHVEYQTDTSRVRLETGPTPEHPLLVCPCHFSAFDPLDNGAVLSGPAYRGLYRFNAKVEQDTVMITQVEEDVLTLLGGVGHEVELPTFVDGAGSEKEELAPVHAASSIREDL